MMRVQSWSLALDDQEPVSELACFFEDTFP